MDQWSNIYALLCNHPFIAVLLTTGRSGSFESTGPGCMEDCRAMHSCWTIGPLHRQKRIVRQQSVDSWHGGSTDVMKIPPIEKKKQEPIFFNCDLPTLSLELLVLQKWFTYQNLQDFIRKTTIIFSKHSILEIIFKSFKGTSRVKYRNSSQSSKPLKEWCCSWS